MIKLALIGVWHVHARDYTEQAQGLNNVTLEKVWDKSHENAVEFAKSHELQAVSELSEILEDETIDGVIICTETTDHDEVIAACARAGKGIFTEKTLAVGGKEARDLAAIISEAKVPFTISFPQLMHPATIVSHSMLGQGMLGEAVKLRFRNAHGGKTAGWLPEYWYDLDTAGGGALMDLGCHPIYVANALLGKPRTVSCTLTPPTTETLHADDEATVVCTYGHDDSVQAILETSFLTAQSPRLFELYGTTGSVLSYIDDVSVLGVDEADGVDENGRPDPGVWLRELDGEEVSMSAPLATFVELVTKKKSDANAPLEVTGYGLEAACQLAEVLEAAYISASEGRVVTL